MCGGRGWHLEAPPTVDCRVGMEMSGEGLRERETMKQGMTDLWATEWPRRLREEERDNSPSSQRKQINIGTTALEVRLSITRKLKCEKKRWVG